MDYTDEYEIECEDCGWLGYTAELVSKTDDLADADFIYCPDCGNDNIVDWE